MAHNESPLLCAILEDTINEFYMASSREGSSGLPLPWRHSMGTPHGPIATTPWPEDALTTQTLTIIPPQTVTSWRDIELSPK
jgi:hypothetical protein